MANKDMTAFSWDDEIEESKFSLLPPGTYKFFVQSMERGIWEPKNGDVPSCPQANLTLSITGKDMDGATGEHSVFHTLRLRQNERGFIRAFFASVGLVAEEGKAAMPWAKVPGSCGVCELEVHEYNGKESNRVTKFYPASKAPKVGKNFEGDSLLGMPPVAPTVNTASAPTPNFTL